MLRGDVRELQPGITVDNRAKIFRRRAVPRIGSATLREAEPIRPIPHMDWNIAGGLVRIVRRRGRRGDGGRYLLANGRGARFGEPQALAKAEFIVGAELDGAEREARIFLAAPLTLADLEEHFLAAHIIDRAEIIWDEREQAVRVARAPGALVLESTEIRNPDAQCRCADGTSPAGNREPALDTQNCGSGKRASC